MQTLTAAHNLREFFNIGDKLNIGLSNKYRVSVKEFINNYNINLNIFKRPSKGWAKHARINKQKGR